MLVLRIAALLALIAIGVLGLSWALTGERGYLKYAWRVVQVCVAFALGFMLLLLAERLVLMA